MRMGIKGDYHIHSVYSHGKGTIEDNVKRAVTLGLKEIGITDHGICSYPNNLPPREIGDFLSDINECREKYPQISVLAGIEANLIGCDGSMDLTDEQQEKFDYIICGYHTVRIMMLKPSNLFKMFLPNIFDGSGARRIVKNTDAYIKAMQLRRVAVIAHPLKDIKCDISALGQAAAEYNVHIEVNEKNLKFTPRDFETLLAAGCRLIIVSDAHSPDKIGQMPTAFAASRAAGIPDEYYANWEKFPDLRFNPKTKLNRFMN